MSRSNEFFCYTCYTYRPIETASIKKDSSGRPRRVCLSCLAKAKPVKAKVA